MAIIFRQSGCVIEYSENNGNTWQIVADLSLCLSPSITSPPGETLRCSIAYYLTNSLKKMQDEVISGQQQSAASIGVFAAV